MEYFADNFFSQVDWKDPVYNKMSVVYEAFGSFTSTISQAKSPLTLHKERLLNALSKLDENSKAYKYAQAHPC